MGKGLSNNYFGLSSRNKYASDNFFKRKTHFSTFCVGKTQFFPTMSFFSVGLLYYSHRMLHFSHLWSPNVWSFFPHIKEFSLTPVDVLKFNSVLTLSKSRETKSAAQGSVPQDLPLPHFRHKSWAHVITCASDRLAVGHNFQWPPLWGSFICKNGSQNWGKHLLTIPVYYKRIW